MNSFKSSGNPFHTVATNASLTFTLASLSAIAADSTLIVSSLKPRISLNLEKNSIKLTLGLMITDYVLNHQKNAP